MIKKNICILLLFFSISITQAQLSFNTTDNFIFKETFGQSKSYGDLPTGISSTYTNVHGRPQDGSYVISSSTYNWFNWFKIQDHTSNDRNGRMLIVNADMSPGEFFRTSVSGLCENTSYEFSSWLINLMPSNHYGCHPVRVPVNIRFEIWDSTDTFMLKIVDTGIINGSTKPKWQKYSSVFKTYKGETSVILKMHNLGKGGCGNDFALDDITFKAHGDIVTIEDTLGNKIVDVYEDELPYSGKLSALPDFSVFTTHAYQWQESKDGVNWTNIFGAKKKDFSIINISNTTFYRVLFADNVADLLNSSCNNLVSEVYKVNVVTIGKSDKTQKKVTIVKNGLKIIYEKVWIDGAKGKFVQTGEEIIKKGDVSADTIVEETTYEKANYGYNSTTRTYRIRAKK